MTGYTMKCNTMQYYSNAIQYFNDINTIQYNVCLLLAYYNIIVCQILSVLKYSIQW